MDSEQPLIGSQARKSSNPMKWVYALLGLGAAWASVALIVIYSTLSEAPSDPLERANWLLEKNPVFDGHNDLPLRWRQRGELNLSRFDLYNEEQMKEVFDMHTDIPRLQRGHVGAQFWSAYVGCNRQGHDAVRATIEQIDMIHQFVDAYDEFVFATTADEVEKAIADKKVASLIGIEGGHSIDSSLGTLRAVHALGVRYLTLTHTCHEPWAESESTSRGVAAQPGLTDFGKTLIKEMNRLGMLVDLSHVSAQTMHDALDVTTAPIMYSHSNAYSLCDHTRNVPDDVLERVKENNGVVMVNFVTRFLCLPADTPLEEQLQVVADHIEYIANKIGVAHVGIGGDFDGATDLALKDVAEYPHLFAELVKRGFSDEDLALISSKNAIRVLRDAQAVAESMSKQLPHPDYLDLEETPCRKDYINGD